jgi:hypothetical protein
VESSCELRNEPSGSIKCWELPSGFTSCGLSSGTQLHRISLVSLLVIRNGTNYKKCQFTWSVVSPKSRQREYEGDFLRAKSNIVAFITIDRLSGLVVKSSWLLTQRSRIRFPELTDFLRSSGSGTGSTQPF